MMFFAPAEFNANHVRRSIRRNAGDRKCACTISTAVVDVAAATAVGNSRASSIAKRPGQRDDVARAGDSARSTSDIRNSDPTSRNSPR